MKRPTRIERIVAEYFMPYNRTLEFGDIDYVMEFLRAMLQSKGKYVRYDECTGHYLEMGRREG